MGSSKPSAGVETAAPARNFTLAAEERMRSVVAGPPAYARRKRRIEDLEDALLARLLDVDARARSAGTLKALLAQINALIEAHNRFYPLEANLPINPRSGALLERGRPWAPLAPVTVEALLARGRPR